MATPSSTSPETASQTEPQGSSPQADEQARRDLPEFFKALQHAQREILRRVTAGLTLAHLTALGVITVLLVVIDQLVSIPETASFLVAAFVSLFMLASLMVFLLRVYYRKPAESLIAQRVESQNPGFKDALVCATEVTQKWREGRQPGRIEKALVERVTGESGGIDFQRAAVPRALGWHYLALGLGVVLLLFFVLSGTQFLGKASAGLGRFLGQTPPGLVVEPGDLSVPENGDVRVTAQVLRWQDEAVIEYQSPEGPDTYPMYARDEAGHHAFTIYGVTDPVRYRVKTPSLSSRWFQLDTYLPPAIRETEIIIEAPAYTQTDTQTLDRLQTLEANEGSRVSWQFTTRGTAEAELSMTGPEGETRVMPLNAGEGQTESFTLEMRAQRSADFFLTLISPEGRQWKSPTYALEVKPDLAPVVEILQPAKDTRLTPADGLEVAGQASDDYGLQELSLWFQVAGKEPVGGPLFQSADHQGETPRARYESAPVRMEHLEVEAGDLVSYYMQAVDNREPEPNVSRSEIYFIEIVEPVTAQQMEGQQGQPQQMEVRGLIEGMKQAIRLSYQAQEAQLSGSDPALETAREQLQAKLLETRANAQQKISELTELTGLSSGFEMMDNLTAAVENMRQAERAAMAQRESEVVEPSQQAIKELLKVEQQLMQNTADQMASRMEDLGKQDQEQQQQQTQQPPRDAMEQMRQAAGELRRMAEEQNALNQGLRAAGGQQISEQEQQQLSERQAELQERAGRQQQQLAQTQGGQGAMAMEPLRQASREMQEALRDINEGEMRSASADGERARESLSQAADAMEQQIQNVLRQQTEALAQMARQLRGRQQQAAQKSAQMAGQEVERSESTEMMEDQQQLRENYRELLDAARELSNQAARDAPRAGNQMQNALQQATEANTEGQMTRAANALLYQRMETASQSQQQAAQQIGAFAQNLDEAAQSMPRLSRQQIAQALEALQRARARMEALANQQAQNQREGQRQQGQQSQQQGQQQGEQSQEGQPGQQQGQGQQASSEGQSGSPRQSPARQAQQSASQMLEDLARTLQDDQLQQLANTMAAREGGGAGTLTQSSEDLRMAIDYIRQNLLQIERERRARLKRQSAPPPGEYRQLVEEYFKILGGAGAEASQN